jgi:hypothetical protein
MFPSGLLASLVLLFMLNTAGAEAIPTGIQQIGASRTTANHAGNSGRFTNPAGDRQRRSDIERQLEEMRRLVSRLVENNRSLSEQTQYLKRENRSLKETVFSLKDVVASKEAGSLRVSPLSPSFRPASAGERRGGNPNGSSAPPASRAIRALDLGPSNPFGMPGTTAGPRSGPRSIHISSAMLKGLLPPIPNLELAYVYSFGQGVRTGRLSVDYVAPSRFGGNGAAFVEAHGEFTNFLETLSRVFSLGSTETTERSFRERTDLSFGGGYRRIFYDKVLVGANGFYDTSRLGDRWYGSAGVGLEFAALGVGNDLVDLTFNYYGDLFQGRNSIINAFRNGRGNFDLEVGYSIEAGANGPDLRLKAVGYQFDVGEKVHGWNAGAEIRTRNGMFRVKAEGGRDKINGEYYTVAGYVSAGLRLERLLTGKSPFTMPEPVFASPRNLRRLLVERVKRNYHQPAAVMQARSRSVAGDGARGVRFEINVQPPVISGGFTGFPATGSTATVNMIANNVRYTTFSINFVGDVGSLPPGGVPVTWTWTGVGGPGIPGNYWGQPGTDGGSMTRNVPVGGGTVGHGGTVYDPGFGRPAVLGINTTGFVGTVTFTAPGVETLVITIVR